MGETGTRGEKGIVGEPVSDLLLFTSLLIGFFISLHACLFFIYLVLSWLFKN